MLETSIPAKEKPALELRLSGDEGPWVVVAVFCLTDTCAPALVVWSAALAVEFIPAGLSHSFSLMGEPEPHERVAVSMKPTQNRRPPQGHPLGRGRRALSNLRSVPAHFVVSHTFL